MSEIKVSHMSDMKNSSSTNRKKENSNMLLAIYRDNFCDCLDSECKNALQNKMRELMKEDIGLHNTVQNMINFLTGSPNSEKMISILIFILNKIHIESFSNSKMDELLNLIVVIYLKCSKAVQLTFINDIDMCMQMIREAQEKLFVEKVFEYKVMLPGIH